MAPDPFCGGFNKKDEVDDLIIIAGFTETSSAANRVNIKGVSSIRSFLGTRVRM